MRGKRDVYASGVTSTKSQRRKLTRKLQGILLQLKAKSEADAFLEPVDDSVLPDYKDYVQHPMDLSTIESKIAEYASANEFLEDVQLMYNNCVAYNGKKHELTRDCATLLEEAKHLVAQLEDEAENGGDEDNTPEPVTLTPPKAAAKSPGKPSAAKAKTTAASGGNTALDSTSKTKLRQVVTTILEDSRALPFSAPISDRDVPGYSVVISQPMDLSTLKKLIKTYTTLDEFMHDFTLIWENCRRFNLDTAPVVATANELETFGWELLSDAFPGMRRAAPQTSGPSSVASSGTKVSSRSKLTPPVESTKSSAGLARTSKTKSSSTAGQKQVPSPPPKKRGRLPDRPEQISAPSSVPGKRTDSKSGESKRTRSHKAARQEQSEPLRSDSTDSSLAEIYELDEDMSSAMFFDEGEEHDVDEREEDVEEEVQEKEEEEEEASVVKGVDKSRSSSGKKKGPKQRASSSSGSSTAKRPADAIAGPENAQPRRRGRPRKDGQPAGSARPTEKLESGSIQAKMKKVLSEMKADPHAGPFMQPVSESDAPGYRDIIDQPNDLTTMTKTLARYGDDVASFKEDMQLIWNNCMVYNSPDSEIWRWAQIMSDRFEALCTQVFQPEQEKLSNDQTAEAKLEQLLGELQGHELAGPFQQPVDESQAPGYSALITNPMDLSTIKQKLSSYDGDVEAFAEDVRLIFNNCREYNLPDSDIYQMADKLSSWFEKRLAALFRSSSKGAKSKKAKQPPKDEAVGHRAAKANKLFSSANRDLSDLEKTALLVSGADGIFAQPVRDAAHRQSQAFLKTLQFPWQFEGFAVITLGKIRTSPAFHNRKYIFPMGFKSQKHLHLRITSPGATARLIPVTFTNLIGESEGAPRFDITITNDVVVASSSHPAVAWESVLQNKHAIILALGAPLRRCRAVLNRLAIDPQIMPFLEKIRPSDASGYYDIIKSPMWLREVHTRIVRGAYDSEFEFAQDVRMIWENCKTYNKEGSELWEIADRLQNKFEHLFCDWVLNLKDRTITDLARGPWDNWTYLRYFDGTEDDVNMCRITGARRDETELLFCCSCEDQYLPSSLDEDPAAVASLEWKCPRCVAAERAEDRSPGEAEYRAASQWKPDTTMDVGWMRITGKDRWLSPFGEEVTTSEGLSAATEAATAQYEERKKTRAAEFAIWNRRKRRRPEVSPVEQPTDSHTTGRTRRRSKWQNSQSDTSAESAMHSAFTRLEDGTLVLKRSSLPTLAIGPQDRLELMCDVGFDGVEEWAVEPEYIPECGFFGFDSDDIRRAIEGLPKAAACENYEFEAARDIRDSMLEEIEAAKEHKRALEEGNRGLVDSLATERWQFQREADRARRRLRDATPTSKTDHGLVAPAQSLLLFAGMSRSEVETVLMVWEFLSTASGLLGDVRMSLEEITAAVMRRPPQDPSGLELPSLEQLYYDELSVTLVKLLLAEMRNVTAARTDKDWAQLLALKPLNILTWPEVARQCLCILVQYRLNDAYTSADVIRALRTATPAHLQRCEDIVCLLMIHPLIAPFMQPVDPVLVPGYLDVIEQPMDLMTIRRKLASYESTEQFAADARLLWKNALTFNPPLSPIANSAGILSTYFEQLLAKWLPDVQPVKTDEETRNVMNTHPAFWGDRVSDMSADQADAQQATVLAPCSDVTSTNAAVLGYFVSSSATELFDASFVNDLEAVLDGLRSTEPEHWTKALRVQVLEMLVHECTQTIAFRRFLSNQSPSMVHDDEAPDITDTLAEAQDCDLQSVRRNAQNVCFVSGLQSKDVPDERWVAVPSEYLAPITSPSQLGVDRSHERRQPVALEHCMRQLITAREAAVADAEDSKRRVDAQVESWKTSGLDLESNDEANAGNALLRTQPLGYDRAGNEYWKFHAMTAGYTTGIGTESRPALAPKTLQDGLLVQQPDGVWKYYQGRNDIVPLLEKLNGAHECEQLLRARIVEAVRLNVTPLPEGALPWVKNRQAQIDWIQFYTPDVLHEMATVDAVKFMETLWARCVESRMAVHMWVAAESLPFKPEKKDDTDAAKYEFGKERRKVREYLIRETMDFHPVDGWLRVGAFDSIKELSATTTATKLLTDPTVASVTSQLLSQSKLRRAGALGSSLSLGTETVMDISPATSASKPKVETKTEVAQAAAVEQGAVAPKRNTRSRPVDQIDPATGRIVKRWPSGNEAATTLQISQGGISLCCKGAKAEAYGFRWRLASDTPPDAEIQELDIETLRLMLDRRRGGRGRSRASADGASGTGSKAKPAGDAVANADRMLAKPELDASVVLVTPRLAKLKSELLNFASIIPPYRLIWDADKALEVEEEDGDTAPATEEAMQKLLKWVASVQQAVNPQQLLDLLVAYEELIPKDYVHAYYVPKAFSTQAVTCAGVACRLFALDRAMRYEDASKFDWRASAAPYRPRVELMPRCIQSVSCAKPFCHWGRCNSVVTGFTRIPELVTPPVSPWPVLHTRASSEKPLSLQIPYMGLPPHAHMSDMLPGLFPEPKRRRQSAPVRPPSPEPVLPSPSEIVNSAWI